MIELMHIGKADAKPIRHRYYRQSLEIKLQMERLTDEILSANTIQISDSPWSSTCLLNKRVLQTNTVSKRTLEILANSLNQCSAITHIRRLFYPQTKKILHF